MSKFEYFSRQLFFEEHGEGMPLLLLHGNTASGRMFDAIVPSFSQKYRVIVPDFLGNGRSEHFSDWPSDLWFEWAKQVQALCVHLGLSKINLIGSSGGALAAINVALENPNLVNAIVADSFEGLQANPDMTEQFKNGRLQALRNESYCSYLRLIHGEDWKDVFCADTDAVLRHAEQIGTFIHKPFEGLSVRMLVTGSLEDEMFPNAYCQVLFGDICKKSSFVKAHIFKHGRHPAMISNVDEFIVLCESFFER